MNPGDFGTLQIAWLEAFVLSADYKKRIAAAEEMHVTQSAVSKYITNLETWLGGGSRRFLMFDNRRPQLTEDGEAFLPVARRILADLRDARKFVEFPPKRTISPADIVVPKLGPSEE